MGNAKRQSRMNDAIVILLVLIAYVSRFFAMHCQDNGCHELGLALSLLRAFIYTGLFVAWGVSVCHRIIQKQVRQYMIAVALLAVFWMVVRTLKFHFVTEPNVLRYLWYSYYIPNILIPLNALFVALYVGKPENYRIPRRAMALHILALALILFVLTNDLHQLVFAFPSNAVVFTDKDYDYNIGFVLVFVYRVVIILAALGILIYKQRNKNLRKILIIPLIPLAFNAIYSLLYAFEFPWLRTVFGDMTVMECVLNILFLECCIRCGLIRSNTGYDKLFHCSGLRVIITDKNFNTLLASDNSSVPTAEQMRQTEKEPVALEGGLRLSGAPISTGYVLWEEVSELREVLAELEAVSDYLAGKRKVHEKEHETNLERQKAVERNRLYNKVMTKTYPQIQTYAELTEQLDQTDDPEEIRRISAQIAVVCAYIKRRDNLIFLDESKEQNSRSEMKFALEEVINAIRLCGVTCECSVDITNAVSFGEVAYLFEAFYAVVTACLDSLSMLLVYVNEVNGSAVLTLRLVTNRDISDLMPDCAEAYWDEDCWVVTVKKQMGGVSR